MGLEPAERGDHVRAELLDALPARHEHRRERARAVGDELLRKLEPAGVDVRDEDRLRARRLGAEQADEPDRARAADDDRLAERELRALDGGENASKPSSFSVFNSNYTSG